MRNDSMADCDFTRQIVTRAEAKAAGSKLYFTGKACPQGHLAPRITINGYCQECSRASATRYRKANPERFRASHTASKRRNNDKYIAARRARRREQDSGLPARQATRAHDRKSRATALDQGVECYESARPCKYGHAGLRFAKSYGCVECWKASLKPDPPEVVAAREKRRAKAEMRRKARGFSVKNRALAAAAGETQYIGAQCKHGHGGLRWVSSYACVECGRISDAKNKKSEYDKAYRQKIGSEFLTARSRAWALKNKDKVRSIKQSYVGRRRAIEKDGMSGPELHAWKKAAKKVCYWCGKKCARAFTVDHYQPLAKGGKHEADNLVIACMSCNVKKNAKDPEQFRAETWHGTLFSSLINP
jgi:5-methylcytosine-specific restriction endonuclease McrA